MNIKKGGRIWKRYPYFAAGFMGNDRNIYFIPAEQYTEDQIDDTKNQ